MKNIFIVGAHPGGNKGAEAMLEVVLNMLAQNPISTQANIFVEALDSGPAYDTFRDRSKLNFTYFRFSPKKLLKPYDIKAGKNDVVIDIGGINYHDRSLRANVRSLVRHAFFIFRGVKLVFFTQDHGPCKKAASRMIAKFVYARAHDVFMRSELSLEFLRELSPKVKISGVYPDCTLLLEKSNSVVDAPSEDYFILAPSSIMFNQHGKEYLDTFVALIEKLSAKYKPVIVVHNFTKNDESSDLVLCRELHRLTAAYNPVLIEEELPPSEFKGLFSDAKFSISSRYHVVVGSFSVNTLAFAIGWNHKYEEFLGLHDMKFLNLRFDDALVANVLDQLSHIEEASFYSKEICKRNTDLKGRVKESFDVMLRSL
jgi:polysaccharide pyruvyl transferase WcaK-like protein